MREENNLKYNLGFLIRNGTEQRCFARQKACNEKGYQIIER